MYIKLTHIYSIYILSFNSHMPCMQRVADKFWVSYKNIIYSYTKRSDNGDLKIDREMIGHHRDVCHFVIKGNTLVSSGRLVYQNVCLFFCFFLGGGG